MTGWVLSSIMFVTVVYAAVRTAEAWHDRPLVGRYRQGTPRPLRDVRSSAHRGWDQGFQPMRNRWLPYFLIVIGYSLLGFGTWLWVDWAFGLT